MKQQAPRHTAGRGIALRSLADTHSVPLSSLVRRECRRVLVGRTWHYPVNPFTSPLVVRSFRLQVTSLDACLPFFASNTWWSWCNGSTWHPAGCLERFDSALHPHENPRSHRRCLTLEPCSGVPGLRRAAEDGDVAQLEEQRTFNPLAEGSIPSVPTLALSSNQVRTSDFRSENAGSNPVGVTTRMSSKQYYCDDSRRPKGQPIQAPRKCHESTGLLPPQQHDGRIINGASLAVEMMPIKLRSVAQQDTGHLSR